MFVCLIGQFWPLVDVNISYDLSSSISFALMNRKIPFPPAIELSSSSLYLWQILLSLSFYPNLLLPIPYKPPWCRLWEQWHWYLKVPSWDSPSTGSPCLLGMPFPLENRVSIPCNPKKLKYIHTYFYPQHFLFFIYLSIKTKGINNQSFLDNRLVHTLSQSLQINTNQ